MAGGKIFLASKGKQRAYRAIPMKKKSKDKKQDKRIKKLENIVYKAIENKQIEVYANASFSDTGSAWEIPFDILQGSGEQNRNGDSVLLQKVQYNIMVDRADSHNRCRVLLVESVNGNESLALSDVLTYTATAVYGDMALASPYTTKSSTNKRYKVHFDKMFEIGQSSMKNTRVFKGTIKFPKGGKVVHYDGTSSVPTDHRLTLMVLSDSTTASHPTIKYVIRQTYKDA
jgi:hypothetical protein